MLMAKIHNLVFPYNPFMLAGWLHMTRTHNIKRLSNKFGQSLY